MKIELLSNTFRVRKLGAEDVALIYALCCKNVIFYRYHPPFVTKESIVRDMSVLPPGKDYNDKFFVGFFENETLVAIMDLIVGYPEQDTCFIGLFMVGLEYQNKGIGSEMINQCVQYLRMSGFHKIRLGVDKNNPQSNAFWKKNGFSVVGEKDYVLMELVL